MKKISIALILLIALSGCSGKEYIFPVYEKPAFEDRPPCGDYYRQAAETKEPVSFDFFKEAWECRNRRDRVCEENMKRCSDKLDFINSGAEREDADNGGN